MILSGCWAFLCGAGIVSSTQAVYAKDLPPLIPYTYYCEQNVRNYLITKDEAYLRHPEIPYPAEWAMKQVLDYPGIARILPASVRPPLAISSASGPSGQTPSFLRHDSRRPEALNHPSNGAAGISPSTAMLVNAVTWGSFGGNKSNRTAEWKSGPIPAASGSWLKFEVAGDFGDPGVSLELRDFASNKTVATVLPAKTPGNSWRSAYVHSPKATFIIAARDASESGWLAFNEPVEMATGSYWAWRLIRHGVLIATIAGMLGIGLPAFRLRSTGAAAD